MDVPQQNHWKAHSLQAGFHDIQVLAQTPSQCRHNLPFESILEELLDTEMNKKEEARLDRLYHQQSDLRATEDLQRLHKECFQAGEQCAHKCTLNQQEVMRLQAKQSHLGNTAEQDLQKETESASCMSS